MAKGHRLAAASVIAAAIALMAPPLAAGAAEPTSSYCKSAYKTIAGKPKKRAMALSADGQFCHSYWNEKSQANADRNALRACEAGGKRKCSIVRR